VRYLAFERCLFWLAQVLFSHFVQKNSTFPTSPSAELHQPATRRQRSGCPLTVSAKVCGRELRTPDPPSATPVPDALRQQELHGCLPSIKASPPTTVVESRIPIVSLYQPTTEYQACIGSALGFPSSPHIPDQAAALNDGRNSSLVTTQPSRLNDLETIPLRSPLSHDFGGSYSLIAYLYYVESQKASVLSPGLVPM